jgi:hypothetical protein
MCHIGGGVSHIDAMASPDPTAVNNVELEDSDDWSNVGRGDGLTNPKAGDVEGSDNISNDSDDSDDLDDSNNSVDDSDDLKVSDSDSDRE